MPLFRKVLGTGALLLAMVCGAASAATVTVTNINDSGPGSLRAAIAAASAGDTIGFAPGVTGTVLLASPLAITQSLAVQGPGAANLTLDGQASFQVFTISGLNVTLSGLTIARGHSPGLAGGVANGVGTTLTITHDVFDSNTAANGAGIANPSGGTLQVDNTTFLNNSATSVGGGGILNTGSATIQSSTFDHNAAGTNGGGVNNQPTGTATLINDTFVGNTSGSVGGAVSNLGTITVADSTFRSNQGSSGAAFASGNANDTINNNIFADNAATGGTGAFDPGTIATASNNVFFNNTAAGVADDGAGYGGSNFVVAPSEPLGPLGNNEGSGPTQTMLPQGVALCEGDSALPPPGVTTDQRGFPRTATVGASTCLDAGSAQVTGLAIPTMPVPLLALLGGLLAMFGLYWTMQARRKV